MCQLADDIQCSVIEEERRQKIFTFTKLESENLYLFTLVNKSVILLSASPVYMQEVSF